MEIGETRSDRITKIKKSRPQRRCHRFQSTLQKSTSVTIDLRAEATLTLKIYRSSEAWLDPARRGLGLQVDRAELRAGWRDPQLQTKYIRSKARQVIDVNSKMSANYHGIQTSDPTE